ncbi:unnamed protein product [Ilex paraguariensis]|uniref:Uncharacterized protein n=1 Tax=Ilex paraguariensis TaxID=185542 RepID=A0ABC8RRU5_9AQUA
MVFKSGLGSKGAALANAISYWISVLLLALYIRISPSCKNTWTGFSKEALHDVPKFLKLAFPSAIMVCLEIWSFETMVLIAGLLPDPELETSVLSVRLQPQHKYLVLHDSLWARQCNKAAFFSPDLFPKLCLFFLFLSVRVSNELGAGRPRATRLAVWVAMFMVATESILVTIVKILGRKVWGYCYSRDERVNYVGEMMLLVASMHLADGIQAVLNGIARGCGWQKIGAIVNFGAYYLIDIPFGILLAFVYHIGGKGLWTGIAVAVYTQMLVLLIITVLTNWVKEAKKASARVFDSMIPIEASQ